MPPRGAGVYHHPLARRRGTSSPELLSRGARPGEAIIARDGLYRKGHKQLGGFVSEPRLTGIASCSQCVVRGAHARVRSAIGSCATQRGTWPGAVYF